MSKDFSTKDTPHHKAAGQAFFENMANPGIEKLGRRQLIDKPPIAFFPTLSQIDLCGLCGKK